MSSLGQEVKVASCRMFPPYATVQGNEREGECSITIHQRLGHKRKVKREARNLHHQRYERPEFNTRKRPEHTIRKLLWRWMRCSVCQSLVWRSTRWRLTLHVPSLGIHSCTVTRKFRKVGTCLGRRRRQGVLHLLQWINPLSASIAAGSWGEACSSGVQLKIVCGVHRHAVFLQRTPYLTPHQHLTEYYVRYK